MVVVRLIGGLGNQLFQYAAARNLAIKHQTELKLDITPFEAYKLHRYSLSAFSIQEKFANNKEIDNFQCYYKKGWKKYLLNISGIFMPYYLKPIFKESALSPFDPNILKTPRNVYLDGYWQSEKYFLDIQDIIRCEFTVKLEQDSVNLEILNQIKRSNSVSIHFRRGDYVKNPETNRIHGINNSVYYKHCINLIAGKINNPNFFVFSDDPEWVKENFQIEYPVNYITHNNAIKNYEDLRLMSNCKHNIIANSSFSWWAAWLNSNSEKIILAPKKWFNKSDFDTRDLLPESWIKVS